MNPAAIVPDVMIEPGRPGTAETGIVPDVMIEPGRLGTSATAMNRNVGTDGPPAAGPARNTFATCNAKVSDIVPDVVIGEPVTTNSAGAENPTLETVPPPPGRSAAVK